MPEVDAWLIQQVRATAGGGRVHAAEQMLAAYRMYGEILRRRPADRETRRKFYATESKLRARQFNPPGARHRRASHAARKL